MLVDLHGQIANKREKWQIRIVRLLCVMAWRSCNDIIESFVCEARTLKISLLIMTQSKSTASYIDNKRQKVSKPILKGTYDMLSSLVIMPFVGCVLLSYQHISANIKILLFCHELNTPARIEWKSFVFSDIRLMECLLVYRLTPKKCTAKFDKL